MSVPAHSFARTTLLIWAGLLLWTLDFLLAYIFAALACEHGFASRTVLDMRVVPLFTTASGLVTAGAIGAVMWSTIRRRRLVGRADDEHARFIEFIALGGCALSLLALLWLIVYPWLLSTECS